MATAADTAMQDLMEAIEDGFPDRRSSLPQCLKAYHAHRRHLTTSDGVAEDQIIVPQALRKTCLSSLHAAHQDTSQMTAKAEASIFWPGITTDIHATRAACDHCNRMAPSCLQYHRPWLTTPSSACARITSTTLARTNRSLFKLAHSETCRRWSQGGSQGTEAHLLHVRHTRLARDRRWPRVHINDHDTIPPRLGCPPSPQLGGIPPQQLQSRGGSEDNEAPAHRQRHSQWQPGLRRLPEGYPAIPEYTRPGHTDVACNVCFWQTRQRSNPHPTGKI